MDMDMESKIDQILKIVTMNQQDIVELKRDVAILKEDISILKEDVTILKEDVAILKEDVSILKKELEILKEKVIELNIRVTKLEERMTKLENSVTLIEHQHGESIRALFDARQCNEDEHKEIKKLCLSIESKIQGTLFNHEKRISKLEGNLVPSF